MSRTKKKAKAPGYDYWSRRSGCMSTGPIAKKITKKQERTRNRKIERQALTDPETVEGRFPGE